MKIELDRGELTLKEGFAIEIKKSNPFFSDGGSFTIPSELPATPENLVMLGNPERAARSRRFVRKFPAVLKGPFMQKKCTLIATALSKSSGVTVSLLLDESSMYSKFKNMALRDIFNSRTLEVGLSRADGYSPQSYFWALYSGDTISSTNAGLVAAASELAVFPVIVKDGDIYHFVNEVNSGKTGFIYAARDITVQSDGSEKMSVPKYYGLSVFLRLSSAVRIMFESFGYNILESDLEKEPWSSIVLLNNCSDILLNGVDAGSSGGRLSYSDMVPDISVSDFLDFLKNKFGVSVFVEGTGVHIKMLERALNPWYAEPDMDLTGYVVDEPEISYPEEKKFKLSIGTSLEGASPMAETLEQLQKENVKSFALLDFDVKGGVYTKYKDADRTETAKTGSNAFEFDRTFNGIEDSDEMKPDDEYVPMVKMGENWYPFIGERRNSHTNIAGKDESQSQDILLCYAFPPVRSSEKYCGSTQPYSIYSDSRKAYLDEGCNGNTAREQLFPLTPEGYYPHTYQSYGAMQLSATPTLKFKMDAPAHVVFGMRLDLPKYMMGTKVIVTSLSYNLDDNGAHDVSLEVRRICDYVDAVEVPSVDLQQKFYWKLVRNLPTSFDPADYDSVVYDGLVDYTDADAPKTDALSNGERAKYRTRHLVAKINGRHTGFMKWEWKTREIDYEEYFLGVSYLE